MTAQFNPPSSTPDEPSYEHGEALMIAPSPQIAFVKPEEEPAPIFSHHDVLNAFAELLPLAAEVKKENFASLNIDIPGAVITALRKAPTLLLLADHHRRSTAEFLKPLRDLTTHALALSFAHSTYVARVETAPDTPKLALGLVRTRALFRNDIRLLARRGLIDDHFLAAQSGTIGYQKVGFDVLAITAVLRGSWHRIEGNSALTLEDIDLAEKRAFTLITAGSATERLKANLAFYRERRRRFFTLFMENYSEVLRAVSYLRWKEEDVADFAPSLYAGRGKRKPVAKAGTPAAPAVPAATGEQEGPDPEARLLQRNLL